LRFPAGEPVRDALKARPPERLRLRIFGKRCEMPGSNLDERAGRVGRQRCRKSPSEFTQRAMNNDSAIGGTGGRIDRVELAQPQNVLGVDGVWIAQPGFDLGH
jgi:hypothetical protein